MCLATLPLVLSLLATSPSGETEVLFLGNSYTGVNDLPTLVAGLAAAGGHTFAKDKNTPGGNTLGAPQSNGSPHMSNATSLAKIAADDWEFVVLQEQSYLPTIPVAKNNFMFPGAQSLDASITANDPATQVLLYQTWGRRFGGQFCWGGPCETFANFGEMQDALTKAYDQCAALIGADVAPVGEAWRHAFELDPGLVLHKADDSHPKLEGSYLAACVFYAKIFDESPLGLSYTAGLDPVLAEFLQRVAYETVFCTVSNYCESSPNSFSSGATIVGKGSTSVAANDLKLKVKGAVPSQPGLFFYGADTAALPFGDGTLCVAGTLQRILPPLFADADGKVVLELDFGTPPMNSGPGMIAAGSTWYFQYWYRDPGGPLGSGYNTTDGLAATFCP